MAIFTVTVKGANGARREVQYDAPDATSATAMARNDRLLVLKVTPLINPNCFWRRLNILPITTFDIEIGLRQLASMFRSNLSALTALQTVEDQSRRYRVAKLWHDIRTRIFTGSSLTNAFDEHRKIFGELTIQLVRVGEYSGELAATLQAAADHFDAQRNLRSMLINALIYPFIAITMTIALSAFLVTTVIPKIADFLMANGSELPAITQTLIDISDWTLANWPILLGSIFGILLLWLLIRISRTGHELEDTLVLHIPVIGHIIRLAATTTFTRAIQMLLASGVTLIDTLNVTQTLLSNRRLRRRVNSFHQAVIDGSTLSAALATAHEFPPMLHRMAAVGETTGSFAEAFGEVANFHEMLLARTIKRLSVTIEPILIAITGLIVGFVYIAFFSALFSIAGTN